MADFVVTSWNGRIGCHIEYRRKKRKPENLSRELYRKTIVGIEDEDLQRVPMKFIRDVFSAAIDEVTQPTKNPAQ
jgi:hypothetical protein